MERSNSRNKLDGRSCFLCGKKGHINKDCPRRRQDEEGRSNGQERKDQVDDPETVSFCGDLLVVHAGEAPSSPYQEKSWVMDSGASHHATPRKSHFRNYTPVGRGVLKMGNGGSSRVIGIGDVCLRTSSENTLVLEGVRHAPNLRLNVILIGKLDEEGFKTTFGDGHWKLTKGASVLTKGSRTSGRYLMKTCIAKGNARMTNGGIGQGGKRGRPGGSRGCPRGSQSQQGRGRSCAELRAELCRAKGGASRANGGELRAELSRTKGGTSRANGGASRVNGGAAVAKENDKSADNELKWSKLTPSSVDRKNVSFRLAKDNAGFPVEGKVPEGRR